MIALLVLHLAAGAVCIAAGDRLGRRASYAVAAVPLAATLAWLLVSLPSVLDGQVHEQHWGWVPDLDLALSLRLDAFAALLLLLIDGIGLCVLVYAAGYHADGGPGLGRQAGLLALFAGAMAGVVLADDLLLLVTCWEVTSITSYLLIGNRHTSAKARAALHALLITTAGGLCLMAGAILLAQEAGTGRMSAILANPPTGVSAALVLVLLGVATKSAQYPFHGWLPGAMVAPTPISAYLHSATMVKAGVYLLARLAPAFADVGWWRPLVVGVGAVTMLAGGLRALRQHDLKLLLAFGTVSQLGFLVVLVGIGIPEATAAGCVLLLAHGAFKAALFFVVGTLDRVAGTRDLRELPVLGPRWRLVRRTIVVSCASMAGVPLVFGFIAKESAYTALVEADVAGRGLIVAAIVAGSALTAAYSWRFAAGVLLGPARRGTGDCPATPPAALAGPGSALAATSLALGLWPALADRLVAGATHVLDPLGHAPHLALWHGWNLPLLLTGVTFAAGAAIAALNPATTRAFDARRGLPNSGDVYRMGLRSLNRFADRVTGVTQSGSLPVYTGVILLTAALLPTVALLLRGDRTPEAPFVGTPAQLPLALLLVGAAIAAATIRRRLSAVLFLGVVGYGMAGLFVVQGAPDLALTQVTVETLSTVLFVLVLGTLPVAFERKSTRRTRALRLVVAGAVGIGVFLFALQVEGVRDGTPVADEISERALPEGNGRNIVNVILVDVRGFDTLGEITVLATASIGMVALARAGRQWKKAPGPTADAADDAGEPVAT